MDIMDRLKGPRRNLPIGIQSFERLRRDGYLYVDKTAFVYELASTGNPYFLSRPRRFGKVCCFLHWKRISVERKSFLKDLPLSSSKQNGTNTLYCILTLMPRITLK